MPCLPPLLAMPVLPDVLIHPHLEPCTHVVTDTLRALELRVSKNIEVSETNILISISGQQNEG